MFWDAVQTSQQELKLANPFTFADALSLLLACKRSANRRSVYVDSLEHYLSRFGKGRESTPLADFTTADVEQWLAQFDNANTRQTWLNRISTLFAFAVRRDLVGKNPCSVLERVTIDRKAPRILSPAQTDLLLTLCPNLCRPYLILGLFAGIRPEELLRLNWEDVSLATKSVTINDAKTRRRRIVALEDRAVKLLEKCPLKSGPLSPSNSTVRRFKRRARLALGWPSYPSDLLRHTAASYLLALHKDAGVVATMLGNSSSVLLRHYHQPVTDADCALFWKIGKTAAQKTR